MLGQRREARLVGLQHTSIGAGSVDVFYKISGGMGLS